MLLIEQSEEWLVQRRYVSEAALRQVLSPDTTVAENVNTATKKGVIELRRGLSYRDDHRRSNELTTSRYLTRDSRYRPGQELARGARLPLAFDRLGRGDHE